MKKKENIFLRMLVDFLEITFISAMVFVLVYFFVGQLLEVTGDSMYPTFVDQEQIIAEKLSIKYKDLDRAEIVIFRHPQQPNKLLIKRVIGLPGEVIKLIDGQIIIDDQILLESYLPKGTLTPGKKIIEDSISYKIADDSYVLMGDNREKSNDSREWGAVKKELIVARALLVYYPIDSLRIIQ